MNQVLKYICIINLFCASFAFAQEKKIAEEVIEEGTPVYEQRYGLRIGGDISKPVRSLFDKNYYGMELVGDYRINYRYYAAAEIGWEKKTTIEDYFTYTTNGQFIKLGVDHNTYGNWYGMENVIFIGGRYAFLDFHKN